MKAILVPAGGSDSDEVVFETAIAVGRLLSAHLDFFHVRVRAGEAAANTPHFDFAVGAGIWNTLGQLESEAAALSVAARDHVETFCGRRQIPIIDEPCAGDRVSAGWREEQGDSLDLLMRRARHSDLVVMGRRRHRNQLRSNILESLLLGCGRPILIAPSQAAPMRFETAMVCWKEAPGSAHAVTAAMPLLTRMKRILIVSVRDDDDRSDAGLNDIARQMAWHGIQAEVRSVEPNGRSTAEQLSLAAQECAADMIVMGAYGHTRIREIVFGGCTESFLRDAKSAVFLVH